MTGWLLLTVLTLMVIAPFFIRYILLVTERTRRRELKQLSKYERSLLSLEELELLKVNVPKYTWLYRGYLSTLLAVCILFCLMVGALVIKPTLNSVTVIYAGFCLVLIGINQGMLFRLLQKSNCFSKTKLAQDFQKQYLKFSFLTDKQRRFRLNLTRVSLIIAIINIGLFLGVVITEKSTGWLSAQPQQVVQVGDRTKQKQQLAQYEKEVKKLEPQLEKIVSPTSQYPADFSGSPKDRQNALLAVQAKLVSLEKKADSISNHVDHESFNLAVAMIRSELQQIQRIK